MIIYSGKFGMTGDETRRRRHLLQELSKLRSVPRLRLMEEITQRSGRDCAPFINDWFLGHTSIPDLFAEVIENWVNELKKRQ